MIWRVEAVDEESWGASVTRGLCDCDRLESLIH
jgi:hypothetical protein